MTEENIAIVTGGGSGIGRQAAVLMATCGYRLALVGRTASKLEQTLELLPQDASDPDNHLVLPVDLCRPDAPKQVVREVLARLAGLTC